MPRPTWEKRGPSHGDRARRTRVRGTLGAATTAPGRDMLAAVLDLNRPRWHPGALAPGRPWSASRFRPVRGYGAFVATAARQPRPGGRLRRLVDGGLGA